MFSHLYENVYFVTITVIGILLIITSIKKIVSKILDTNLKSNYKKIYQQKYKQNYEEQFKSDILKILEIIKKEKSDIKKELNILSDLADLKMKKYDIKIDKDNICVICLDHLNSDITKKNCNHFFHISCLKNWHKINRNCPICRK
jgi:hypothetical protein